MSHYRADYRSAVRDSLAAVTRFADFTVLSAWSENIDASTLPVMAVVTPSERSSPSTHGSFERGTLLQVILKRQGGDDIEDDLDDDAAAGEAAVLTAFAVRTLQCLLEEVTTVVNGEGSQRIGTVTLSFRVTSWRSAAP